MSSEISFSLARIRPLIFVLVTALHVIVIVFAVFNVDSAAMSEVPAAGVMKLVDVEEDIPPPEKLPDIYTNTLDSVAETMIETEVVTPPIIVTLPAQTVASEIIDYLPQHRISKVPVLPESEIIRAMVYPPIAQRSNIEGIVYLELFIDRTGAVRDVRILRETPPDRGFGEAAIKAFRGIRGQPAEANGEKVAVRYRYNLNFKLN